MAATKQKKRGKDFINTSYASRALFFRQLRQPSRRSAVMVLSAQAAACACAAATFRAATGSRSPFRAAAVVLPCFFRFASCRQRSPPPVPRPGERTHREQQLTATRKKVLDIFSPLM